MAEGILHGFQIVTRGLLGQARQYSGRRGDGEYAQRKLDDPVGVVKIGHTALGQQGSQLGIYHYIDLVNGGAENRRSHESYYLLEPGVKNGCRPAKSHPVFHQKRQLESKLGHTTGQNPHRQAGDAHLDRFRGPGKNECGNDHCQVQHYRCCRRSSKVPQ